MPAQISTTWIGRLETVNCRRVATDGSRSRGGIEWCPEGGVTMWGMGIGRPGLNVGRGNGSLTTPDSTKENW